MIKPPAGFTCLRAFRRKKKFKVVISLKSGRATHCLYQPMKRTLWKGRDEQVKYLPLQAQEGDLAIFVQKGAIEVMYENEKYFIVPQSSILMLEREEDL